MTRGLLLALLLLVEAVNPAPWRTGYAGIGLNLIPEAAANEVRGRTSERAGRTRAADRNATDARGRRTERTAASEAVSFRDQRQLPEAFKRSSLYQWEYGEFDGRTLRNSVPDRPDIDTIRDHLRVRARFDASRGEIKRVSMYSDLPTAERATDTVLRQNKAEIERWLQSGDTQQQSFNARFQNTIGITMDVESGSFFNANRSTVVLRRTADGRFSVVESYPDLGSREVQSYAFDATSGIKAVNLPAWKSVGIDMAHVAERHAAGGALTAGRTVFPAHMSQRAIERTIRSAYRHGKRMETQGDRVRVRGQAEGLTVEMWVDTITKTIETAYPVF